MVLEYFGHNFPIQKACIILWNTWKLRNEVIFRKKPLNTHAFILSVETMVTQFLAATSLPSHGNTYTAYLIHVKWIAPPLDFVKINTDGAHEVAIGLAAYGVVIRNSQGEFITVKSSCIGVTSNVMAELIAIREGQRLAIELRLLNIIIATNSAIFIALISQRQVVHQKHKQLVQDIRQLSQHGRSVKLEFCYREANVMADLLAADALANGVHDRIFLDMPICHLALLTTLFWKIVMTILD